MEKVPTNGINGHMMRIERVQKLIVVRFRTFVNLSFFRADDEKIILLRIEIETRATTLKKERRGRSNRGRTKVDLPKVVNGTPSSGSAAGLSNFNWTTSV